MILKSKSINGIEAAGIVMIIVAVCLMIYGATIDNRKPTTLPELAPLLIIVGLIMVHI